nr:MAG TPA: hypothetical protein [Caudoviricetes sp.]
MIYICTKHYTGYHQYPSTGCSRVRSPDSFTELNVFDFTYPTNVLG